MYEAECNDKTVKLEKYRDTFNKNFNLSFHIPKKDQCITCNVYYRALEEGNATTEIKESFN